MPSFLDTKESAVGYILTYTQQDHMVTEGHANLGCSRTVTVESSKIPPHPLHRNNSAVRLVQLRYIFVIHRETDTAHS